jgi:Tripartite tricarboxylate transporter TctB family
MVEGRTITAAIMFTIFLVMVGLSFTYEPDARFLPLVIGVPGLALAALQLVVELRAATDGKFTPQDRRAEWGMFGWFVLFCAGIVFFGFPYAGPVLVAAYLYLSWREKWYVCLAACVFAWAVLYGVFEQFLGLPLFEGLAYQWVFA